MNSSKEVVLSKVRGALAPLAKRAPLPDWDAELAEARKLVGDKPSTDTFIERLGQLHGRTFRDPAEIAKSLVEGGWKHGYCDPKLWSRFEAAFKAAGLEVEFEYDRTRIDDFAFGITAARAGIAETGSILIDDAGSSRRLGALTPWVHIAVLPEANIHAFLADAVCNLGTDPNIILITGPSKTADVEGILIEGAHGPGQQWILLT